MLRGSAWLLLGTAAACAADPGLRSIREDELLEHVRFLADDRLAGRGSGSEGAEEAARYVAQSFARCGLKPGGEFGTYFQHFDAVAGRQVGDGTRFVLNGEEQELGLDFAVLGSSGQSRGAGGLVFAGYGIAAPDQGRDDYADLEVAGRIVVALTGAPGRARDAGPFTDTAPGGIHARDRKKAETAYQKQAAGLILVLSPLAAGDEFAAEELPEFSSDRGEGLSFPAVVVPASLGRELLAAAGLDLDEVEQALDGGETRSLPLEGMEATLEVVMEPVVLPTANVIGILPGKGPRAHEAIVIGAHYDHLGEGGSGSLSQERAIHNGADDNASGTAALLELAEACTQARGRFERTLVFVAFSGEELGLLGSAHYVKDPAVPIEDTVAMLNFDMVGRSKDGYCAVGGAGSAPELDGLAAAVNEALGLELRIESADGGMARGSSDHQSFLNAEVPSLFFFSGLHEDYHRPSDDWDKVNATGTERIARLGYGMLRRIDAQAELAFTPPPAPTPHAAAAAAAAPSGERPWFGSIPSFGEDAGEGVLFAGVTEGSPAARAGLAGGDRLVEFGGQPVRTLEDFTVLLGARRPGDRVQVVVERGGARVETEVLLAVRP